MKGGCDGKRNEGRLLGLDCVTHSYGCPIDHLDPHNSLQRDFVFVLDDGDHYLLTNVPREVKARHSGKVIKVSGNVNNHNRYISVENLKVNQGGSYRTVWV